MSSTSVYKMEELNINSLSDGVIFIFAPSEEVRSTAAIKNICKYNIKLTKIVIINYGNTILPDCIKDYRDIIINIKVTKSPVDFINNLKKISASFMTGNIVLDITCIHVPEMFTLIKFLKMQSVFSSMDAVYSLPNNYIFNEEPFTSYKSFVGDLKMIEPLGFSGTKRNSEIDLFLFIGFEGPLALKVVEDCSFRNLNLVNSLPSFFPKYKDIANINNYQLMQYSSRTIFVPADNPFETYNMLSEFENNNTEFCIAPLSTKPIALGVCLFALDNESVRVVYPISENYNMNTTRETYKTYLYHIDF